jgi:hypothetical protein
MLITRPIHRHPLIITSSWRRALAAGTFYKGKPTREKSAPTAGVLRHVTKPNARAAENVMTRKQPAGA